jgi:2-C-methyl-D-erythritol 4-phosphate cytidylyltransferase
MYKKADFPMNIAVIFAGGSGLRMRNSATPKQFLSFHDKPILIHTLEHFQAHPKIDAISLAILPSWRKQAAELIQKFDISKVRWLVDGGATGQLSIYNALQAIETDDPSTTFVLMHDGVRPLINANLITRVITQVHKTGTAVTCFPTIETTIRSSDHAHVDTMFDRQDTFTAQAPQAFRLDTLLACHTKALKEGKDDFIDSCSLFRAYKKDPVSMV